jgi:uncharacterized RDD family membrane protein YckC
MSDPFSNPPPPESFGSTGHTVVPCSNGVRLGAALLDLLLIVVTCGIGWLIWSVVLWPQATSPAKKMLKLRIVDLKTGAPATMQQMLLRELLGKYVLGSVTSGITSFIGAIMILVQPSRQGVWDYLSRTTVVREG